MVKNRSVQNELLEFLKHVDFFPKLFRYYEFQKASSLVSLILAFKSPASEMLPYGLEQNSIALSMTFKCFGTSDKFGLQEKINSHLNFC